MKKRSIKQILFSFCFLLSIVSVSLFFKTDVHAAGTTAPTGTISNLRQINASGNYVYFSFKYSGLDAYDYFVEASTDKVNWSVVSNYARPDDTSVELTNSGSTYYIRVTPYNGYSSSKIPGTPSAPLEVVTAPSGNPADFKQTSADTNSMKIEWKKVSGATGYEIFYWQSTETYSKAKKVRVDGKTSATLSSLSKNAKYNVRVYPYRKSSTGFVAVSNNYTDVPNYGYFRVKPSKASTPEVEYYWQNLKELAVGTKDINCADGYEFQAYTAFQKNDKKVTSVSSTAYRPYLKSNKFGKHNAYKIRVRAYVKVNGNKVNGAWSDWRYTAPQPDVTRILNQSNGQKLTWDTIKGADRYVVYASTKQKSGYKKVATVNKKTSTTIKKINKKALKKKKTYYYYVVAQKKVGKKYISLEPGNADYCWYRKYL